VIDPVTGTVLAQVGKHDVMQIGDDGIYVGSTDGTARRWTNTGHFDAHTLFTLDAAITNVSERRGVVAAVVHDRELVRTVLATGATTRTVLPREIERLAVGVDGRVWAANDRTLWSWDGRSEPHALELAAKVTSLYATRDQVIVGTASSVVLPEATPPVTVTLGQTGNFSASSDSTWLAAQAGDAVALLETSAAHAIRLPLDVTPRQIRVTRTGLFIASDGGGDAAQLVQYYAFTVPTEPAALQRWLRDVTNARAVPGSEATVWP
jgi:hypothetical protein